MSVFFTADNNTQDNAAGPGIMFEAACEPWRTCDAYESAFKGLTAQWMGETMQVAPFTTDKIMSYLQSSAEGAAKQCSGGQNGTSCGTRWTKSKYDGKTGLGQEYSAFNVFLANLAVKSSAPTNMNTTVTAQAADGPKQDGPTLANGPTPSPTNAGTSGTPTARPSSGSQRLWVASWTPSLVIPAVLLLL